MSDNEPKPLSLKWLTLQSYETMANYYDLKDAKTLFLTPLGLVLGKVQKFINNDLPKENITLQKVSMQLSLEQSRFDFLEKMKGAFSDSKILDDDNSIFLTEVTIINRNLRIPINCLTLFTDQIIGYATILKGDLINP